MGRFALAPTEAETRHGSLFVTKRSTCTQAEVRRIIKAAEREGYQIAGIKPDGTIIVCKQTDIQTESLVLDREAVL